MYSALSARAFKLQGLALLSFCYGSTGCIGVILGNGKENGKENGNYTLNPKP